MSESLALAAKNVAEMREFFFSGATRPYEWRLQQIGQIVKLIDENMDELLQCLMDDSGKAEFTAFSGDALFVRAEALYAMKHLKKWMKPKKIKTPLMIQPAKSYVRSEPLGVVLIIGAWNFPIHLTLGPLVGALAAGNTALIKPSEVSPKVAAFLTKYVPKYFNHNAVRVMEGGVQETSDILEQRFDKILYTGNGHVAKIIMAAAAKHLTPVLLELGGKNPCIVHSDCNLEVSCNRIVDNKFSNAGQICVAPDYVLVHEDIVEQFLNTMRQKVEEFYGKDPKQSNAYSRVINERHVQRLKALMTEGEVVCGGEVDEASNYIAPTIFKNVPLDAPIMQDEIFGPLLPVFTYKNIYEAIEFVNQRERPLAFYIFSEDKQLSDTILSSTNSGAAGVNCVMIHASVPELPFGGVGASGMGAYHGKHSFDAMSHQRGVVDKSTRVDPRGAYPPFDDKQMAMRKKITRWLMS